jgi:2-keto-4-pentenoate hydratase/2-oxohepta-3-ene-1,7-dioic acid hydratase in catechol pathway
MLLYRTGPEGQHAVSDGADGELRLLLSNPLAEPVDRWQLGRPLGPVGREGLALLAPVLPGKIVGIGRNYVEHAREMDNPVPSEPLLFLKAPSSLIGPGAPVVLPLESQRVEYEGEIAVVLRRRLRRATAEEALAAVLGVTAACDVTARDLQRKDATFARAKSFDTFCPLGPAILIGADPGSLGDLTVVTRLNGEERQRGHTREMVFGIADLLVYTSRMMTLEPGDIILTGTPGGVGPLAGGDRIEVEVSGAGVLANPVETWKQAPAG